MRGWECSVRSGWPRARVAGLGIVAAVFRRNEFYSSGVRFNGKSASRAQFAPGSCNFTAGFVYAFV